MTDATKLYETRLGYRGHASLTLWVMHPEIGSLWWDVENTLGGYRKSSYDSYTEAKAAFLDAVAKDIDAASY